MVSDVSVAQPPAITTPEIGGQRIDHQRREAQQRIQAALSRLVNGPGGSGGVLDPNHCGGTK